MSTQFDSPSMQMQASPKQDMQLAQKLIMSAHMQQALHLLQLPLLELEPFIEEQVVQNPLLEIENKAIGERNSDDVDPIGNEEKELDLSEENLSILSKLDEDWREHFNQDEKTTQRNKEEDQLKSYVEQSIYFEPSLYEQLVQEAHDVFLEEETLKIAEILIGYIDRQGFLTTPLAEIAGFHQLLEKDIEPVLKVIQTFYPYGVGAATTQESLLIQLKCLNKTHTLAFKIIEQYYDELLHNQIPLIQKYLKCSYEDITAAIENDIAKLDLHPGTTFTSSPVQTLIPDVTVRQEEDQLIVDVDKDFIPSLKLNHRYLKMLQDENTSQETKQFIKRHLFSARWLMRNLQQRYSTIERIAQSLAIRQYLFFTQPNGQLVPLTMKMIADELDLHESTIARTVANKYLFSPRGLLPLKLFFTNKYLSQEGEDLSSSTVKQAVFDLVNQEDKMHPLSDEKISHLLKDKGIKCARRTVAKYRHVLQIGNTQQRKKFS